MHVERTKTWMRDLSSVCRLNSKANHTRIAVKIQNEYRAAVTDNSARCDTRTNLSLVLPLAAFTVTNTGRENRQACLYTAFKSAEARAES